MLIPQIGRHISPSRGSDAVAQRIQPLLPLEAIGGRSSVADKAGLYRRRFCSNEPNFESGLDPVMRRRNRSVRRTLRYPAVGPKLTFAIMGFLAIAERHFGRSLCALWRGWSDHEVASITPTTVPAALTLFARGAEVPHSCVLSAPFAQAQFWTTVQSRPVMAPAVSMA